MTDLPIRRILLVDDEVNVARALRRCLRSEPYETFHAENAEMGLSMLKAQHFDLVISDHLMPGMTGLEFLVMVRDRYPDVVRLMLTGHAEMHTAIAAINDGAIYRFLTKPWDETELKVTLHIAFEQADLERENRLLLATVRRQSDLLRALEELYPGIARVRRDHEGCVLVD